MQFIKSDIIIYVCILAIGYLVLRNYNIIGNKKGVDNTKKLTKKANKKAFKRSLMLSLLGFCSTLGQAIGGELSALEESELRYRIDRLNLQPKWTGRNYKPIEYAGIFRVINLVAIALGCITMFVFRNPAGMFFFILLTLKTVRLYILDSKIQKEDVELEQQFPDFYLLICSRLLRGAYIQLSPTLKEYTESVSEDELGTPLLKFIARIQSSIDVYADDKIAIVKMRDIYRSAIIINFINLTVQALSGVDNAEKLNAFKNELMTRKLKQMEQKAVKAKEKIQREILLVYVIVFEFVLISWLSKIGPSLSGLRNMFGSN